MIYPADTDQCQCVITPAYSAFSFGPPERPSRCTRKPTHIATEKQPAKDMERGEMSLCGQCLCEFLNNEVASSCNVTLITSR